MIDAATAEKLLYVGIVLIVAATVGGGLDATGVISIPTLRSWKVQAGVGAIGVLVMALSLSALNTASATAAQAQWQASMAELAGGAVGVPPPLWKPEQVRFNLVELLLSAGDNYVENCSVAAFVLEYSDKLDSIPPEVKDRMQHPLPAGSAKNGYDCYAESLGAAEVIQTNASRGSGTATVHGASSAPVGDLGSRHPLVASRDDEMALVALQSVVADGTQVATSSAARILESLTAVGDKGYMYLGVLGPKGLGSDRTVVGSSAAVGKTATVRVPVNLRAIGNDSDFANHTVYRILDPGTQVDVEWLTPATQKDQWGRVHVVALPPST
jgi:hypothetical protein